MSAILIADSGPLISLAAANLLHLLLEFDFRITDVVKNETIDLPMVSNPTQIQLRIRDFYLRNIDSITVEPTTIGAQIAEKISRGEHPLNSRNLGELSVQSWLIHHHPSEDPILVLYEDAWFENNQNSLPASCRLAGLYAFLLAAERNGLIPDADAAVGAIRKERPHVRLGL